jgi:hypothetical protein
MYTDRTKQAYAEAWMMYLSGNFNIKQIAEILDIPYPTLMLHSSRNSWNIMRRKIHKEAGRGLKESLAERIEKARLAHQHFMLDQLDETAGGIERKVIGETDFEDKDGERIVKTGDKLNLLEQQHRVAASVLKLDEVEKVDPVRVGFEFLLQLSAQEPMKQLEKMPSAILPLEANSEASTGIIRSNNAYPDDDVPLKMQENQPVMEVSNGVARPVNANDVEIEDITPQPVKLSFK